MRGRERVNLATARGARRSATPSSLCSSRSLRVAAVRRWIGS